jgi:epoxyqueuosine reductase
MNMDHKKRLSSTVLDLAKGAGAVAVGIATTETLKGGPPSTDLSYVLPGAKSAIVFALPLDQNVIGPFLTKQDMAGMNINNHRVNTMAGGIALEIAEYLSMKGNDSIALNANGVYRKDVPGGVYAELPPISHRYLAVRSGVGYFGLSGNIIMDTFGASIILGSAVTTAELLPTDPLPQQKNYCDDCRLCMASCASGLMSTEEKTTVTMGEIDFIYSKRLAYSRCEYVCGGFTGLHASGKWSTWSPARFPIPEKDEDFPQALMKAVPAYQNRPRQDFGCNIYHPLVPGNRLEFTCGHCQFVCHPDKAIRKKRFEMIVNSGVVIQDPDGVIRAVSPEAAKRHLAAMDRETRAFYEEM